MKEFFISNIKEILPNKIIKSVIYISKKMNTPYTIPFVSINPILIK